MSSVNQKETVLLVDDESQILLVFSIMLKSSGISSVATIEDSRQVMPFLKKQRVSVIVLDLSMPFISGEELLKRIRREYPEIPVIIVTANNTIDSAVDCMKNGASDYLVKPVEKNRLISSIQKIIEIQRLESELSRLKDSLLSTYVDNEDAFAHIITSSAKMLGIFKYIEAVSASPMPILITGETGVGKELFAKAIHRAGGRDRPFVAVNVAGLDDNMFTDTLFGHQKGAFTGAEAPRQGLVSRAENGVLFLDEIGDLTEASQVKLLRLIQEREYYALGSDSPRKTSTRVIVATNKNIEQMSAAGAFRRDLYFRLIAHQINIPPLRERLEDIPFLLEHFIKKACKEMKRKIPAYPVELIQLLKTYDFPGNVRELEVMIYDAVSRHESGVLSLRVFKDITDNKLKAKQDETFALREKIASPARFLSAFPTLKQAEQFLIEQALKKAEGNQSITASLLGISRQALNKRLVRKRKHTDGE